VDAAHREPEGSFNPANKRKYKVLVVGSGLGRRLSGGHALAARLRSGIAFCYQTAHGRRALDRGPGRDQAAKNYQGDGDSVYRLFHDTVKGGGFPLPRGQRLPAGPNFLSHHRTSAWPSAFRSPASIRAILPTAPSAGAAGLPHVLRPRSDPASSSCWAPTWRFSREGGTRRREDVPASEMLEPRGRRVGGRAPSSSSGISPPEKDLGPHRRRPSCSPPAATATLLPVDQRQGVATFTSIWRGFNRRGRAFFRQPLFHPESIRPWHSGCRGTPVRSSRLMSESLRTTPIWVSAEERAIRAPPSGHFLAEQGTIFWSGNIPASATSVPRDVRVPERQGSLRRRQRRRTAGGRGGVSRLSRMPFRGLGLGTMLERYGNLFEMYERITGESPRNNRWRIYPAIHYTMGGLWVRLQPG